MMTNSPSSLASRTAPPARPAHPSFIARFTQRVAILFLIFAAVVPGSKALAAGTWTSLTNTAPSGVQNMLLLTDGSVMAHTGGNNWSRLVPDSTGSYANGTWTRLAPMNDSRTYFACAVLKDGRVFVAGGEYGNGGSTAEMYDPRTNTWTRLPVEGQDFIDMPANTLPNGNLLASGTYSSASQGTPILDITTNTWITGPLSVNGMGEATWLKLPDGSILSGEWGPDTGAGKAERYIPSLNQWISEPPSFPLSSGGETGPAFLLPNGNAIFMGYSQTGIYTPSGNNNPGTWTTGPVVPSGLNCGDSSGAMMTNGILLFTANPYYLSGPTSYFEYDYTTNTCTQITAPPNDYGGPAFNNNMLCLPDGKIMVTTSTNHPSVYAPGSAALAAGKPAITSIVRNSDGTYTLNGTLLNGITEGASYGDDQQMATNYPVVRLVSSGGTVYYARTYGWSSTGLMTGSTPESTQFTLPVGIPAGTYSVVVSANGNPSAGSTITIPATSDAAPTVATAAAASPATVTGLTTVLSILGADDGGESNLTYTWNAVAPSGAALPSYSANGTNAAKNTTVTFTHAGAYTFTATITDAYGLSTTSSVSVTVNQTLTSVTVTPASSNLTSGQTQQLSAKAYDQFAVATTAQPTFTWAIAAGGGTVSTSGLYTSPSSGTAASITATTSGIQGAAAVYVVSSPWISADVGSVGIAGSAYDSGGVFTVNGEGNDIWGTADQFHYVYRTMGGDGMMIARVASQENTGGWAKAGVMVRASTADGDQFALMMISPGNGTDLQYRTTSGGSAAHTGNKTGLVAPYYLKLVRSGNTLTGYRSADGATWTLQGSTTIAMTGQVLIGLAVDSVDTSQLNTSTFDHVSMMLASNDALAVNPGAAGTVNVLSNDIGPSGATLTVTAVTQGAKGAVVNNGNGTVTYTANTSAIGIDSFTYTVSDGLGDTATATVNVTINGLQAYYKMDEGSGTTTADATGDGYTATLSGTTWGSGIEGTGGLGFNGSSDYATVPALNLNSNTVTVTAWVSRNGSQNGWSGIVFSRANGTTSGLHFGTANELRYTWNNSSSTYNWNSGLVVPNATWTFVALVVTPSNATIYMQPLGGSMTSATNTVANSVSGFTGVTDIGQDPAGGRFFNGSLDEVRIYNTSLSSTALTALANPLPTVVAAAASSANPVTGTTTTLSGLGASTVYNESSLTYTWAATSVPSGASAPSFSPNGTNAAKSSTATFNGAGAYTLQVTIADPAGSTVTSSVNVTINQTLTSVALSPASSSLSSHGSQQFVATARDQFGAVLAAQPGFTWSNTGVGSVNSSGLYSAPYASGTATVKATTGSVNGTAGVTVINTAPTVATAASASPSTVTGTTSALSVLGADSDGGGEASLTYTWSATTLPSGASAPTYSANGTNAAKNTTATFSKAGSYTLAVTITDAGGLSAASSVNVTVNQTLKSISVSPANGNVGSHGTQQLTASAVDQFGAAMSPAISWSCSGSGSVNSSGLYTASYASGSATITASSGGVSGTSILSINNASPTVATAAAASPGTVTGTTAGLSVLGADGDGGGESSLTYLWAATALPSGAAAPTFSANGTNGAKATTATFAAAGTYTFLVAITDAGGLSTTSSVNVTVNQTLTGVKVSPAATNLSSSQTLQLTGTGLDQFGAALSAQPSFTWAVSGGTGTVSSTGLYTAPAVATVDTVTATSGTLQGSAQISVVPGLVDDWKFDDGTGATAADSGPGAHPGTISGATWATGLFGGALSFNGSSSTVTFGTGPSLNGTTDFTVSAWVKTTAVTTGVILQQRDSAGYNGEYQLSVNSSGAVVFWIYGNGAYQFSSNITTTMKVNDGQWHLVTAVRQGAAGQIYIDGTSAASATGTVRSLANTIAVAVGGDVRDHTNYFNGSIDYVRIYNVALSAAQIGAAMGNQAPTVATAAAASANPVTGGSVNLSALGADDGGESGLTYTWAATSVPSGVSTSALSANGTNAAKNTTATFNGAGGYTFTVTMTDAGGLSATSSVSLTVGGGLPAGWAGADVGSVGVPGWSSANGGTYAVNGSGADIGGTADAFQFSSQTLTGDGEIRARVTSQSNTNAAAKAGVMMRDGSPAGAVNALVALTPGNGFVFQSRSSAGGATTQGGTTSSQSAPNNWVRLTRSGTLVTAYVSADGSAWTQIGTTTLSMSGSISVGLAVTSDNNSVNGTATFDNVSVTPLPAPWQTLDLGTTGLLGSAEYFNGAYTVKGAGTVSGTADNFRYLYQTLSGDGSIVARVSNPQNTGTGAILGVMIRDGLVTGSMYAGMAVDGTGAFKWQSRNATGGNTTVVSGGTGVAPNIWVKLVRSGSTLTGYQSADGVNWTQVSTQSIAMGTNIYLGFVCASGSTSALNATVFDNVTVVP